ncbi:MAG TPA: hypothetical protein VNJ01_07210 [Bacteriovoracaceae bacterium]|nr:hypothetical protein [Bacteriovoracaceae bacterium]
MATVSEIQSLETIEYKGRRKLFLLLLLCPFLFALAFMNYFPAGDKIKALLNSQLKNTGCNPDFDQIKMEWFMPKLIITDLVLPATCLGRAGEPIKLNHATLNYHLVNFSPLGLPFRLDTELQGQPLSLYFVQGLGKQMIRLKDQKLSFAKLQPLLGSFKLAGNVTVDLSMLMENKTIKDLSFKAASENLEIPGQSIQGFTIAALKLNKFFMEAHTEVHPNILVKKLIIGDPDSPIRADFKGKIDLQDGAIAQSPMELKGEVAFSENFKQTLPLIDMMFQSFTQKDGFYQIRLGGTLGAPKPSAL